MRSERVRVVGHERPGAVDIAFRDLGREEFGKGLIVLRTEVANIGCRICIRSRGGRIKDVTRRRIGKRGPHRVSVVAVTTPRLAPLIPIPVSAVPPTTGTWFKTNVNAAPLGAISVRPRSASFGSTTSTLTSRLSNGSAEVEVTPETAIVKPVVVPSVMIFSVRSPNELSVPAVIVLEWICWGLSPKSSKVTATWPAVIPRSPDTPLSVGSRPWLTVSAGVPSFSEAVL